MKIKNTVAKLFTVSVVMSVLLSLGYAKANTLIALLGTNASTNCERFPLSSGNIQNASVFLNNGYPWILVSVDGDSDLDWHVYDGNGLISASGNCGDKIIPLIIYRNGYFSVKGVNRGKVYNDFAPDIQ